MAWHVTRQDLERFANLEQRRAQELLPDLVGKLILATITPKHFRFPKGNDVSLPGYDGEVESEDQTAQIPQGYSVWQVSVRTDFKVKANEDFIGKKPNPNWTYVQLFLHEWPSRQGSSDQDWIASVKDQGWKDVHVISGTQLIDWIEACPAVHRWLAGILKKRYEDHIDAEEGWKIWTNETKIACNREIVISDREYNIETFKESLLNEPCRINIIGESVADSLAFVYSAIGLNDILESRFLDVRRSQNLLDIFSSPSRLILLVSNHSEGIGYAIKERNHHIVYLQDKNDYYNADVTIRLNSVSFASRQSALTKMGFKKDHAYAIAEQTSNKLDFIRIHPDLGPNEVNKFEWMKASEYQSLLKAFTIVNYLNLDSHDEAELLSKISRIEVQNMKNCISQLEKFENSPLKVYYSIIEVESPIILYSLFSKHFFTDNELIYIYADIFGFVVPRYNDQPESCFYNVSAEFKERAISALRMVSFKLSIQHELTDANISQVEYIINSILNTSYIGLIKRFLFALSEISPKQILDFIENKLEQDEWDEMIETLNGNDYVLFTSLEMIGQHSMYLPRVSRILWQIAQTHADENTNMRAINSLENLHLPQWPQTSASQDAREEVVKQLLIGNDDRTWTLLLALLPTNGLRHRFQPYTPKWKDWLRGRSKPSGEEITKYINDLADIAIEKTNGNPSIRWIDLIRILPLLPDASFNSCIAKLTMLLSTEENADRDLHQIIKSELRALINIYTDRKSKRGLLQPEKMASIESLIVINSGTYESDKCFYILTDWHPQVDGVDEAMPHNQKKEYLEIERLRCLKSVYEKDGIGGLESIIGLAKNPSSLMFAFDKFTEFKTTENIIKWLSSQNIDLERIAGQIINWITNRDSQWLIENSEIFSTLNDDNLLKLLSYSILSKTLLQIVNNNPHLKERFWTERQSFYITEHNSDIVNDVVEILLHYNRLHDCIDCLNTVINYNKLDVNPELVFGVLNHDLYNDAIYGRSSSMVLNDSYINDLIEWLKSKVIDESIMIQIEWNHFESIESNHSIPGITLKKLVSDPVYFVEMFVERTKEISNSAEVWERVRKGNRLVNLYALLDGFQDTTSLLLDSESLQQFVQVAMDHSKQLGENEKIGVKLGRILSHSLNDPEDGLWPCKAVRTVLELVNSKEMQNGLVWGIISPDTIGVRYISDEKDQFKEEILKYTIAAEKLNIRFPNTSRLLSIIANDYQQRNSQFNQRFL